MGREDYYQALAERIVSSGLKLAEVTKFATYRSGKSWSDLIRALKQATEIAIGKSSETLFDGTAIALEEVLEIGTSESLFEYEQRLTSTART